jgi:hypothetical protein
VTIYANLVSVRTAGTDIVLEFGCFFPDSEHQRPPKDAPPELRVVLARELIGPLVDILGERLAAVGSEQPGNTH